MRHQNSLSDKAEQKLDGLPPFLQQKPELEGEDSRQM